MRSLGPKNRRASPSVGASDDARTGRVFAAWVGDAWHRGACIQQRRSHISASIARASSCASLYTGSVVSMVRAFSRACLHSALLPTVL